jgi:hypothetical protein
MPFQIVRMRKSATTIITTKLRFFHYRFVLSPIIPFSEYLLFSFWGPRVNNFICGDGTKLAIDLIILEIGHQLILSYKI